VRIDPNVPVPNSGQSKRTSEAKSAGAARPAEHAGGGPGASSPVGADSASISQLATQLGNFPEVRQGRVQALRLSVQNGSYRADPGTVAQSMLGELYQTGSQS
jgi:flagellar biosynthesis anti-sigma factor FlgM